MSEGEGDTEMTATDTETRTFEITASAPGQYLRPDVIEINARSHAAADIYFRNHPGFRDWTVHNVRRTA